MPRFDLQFFVSLRLSLITVHVTKKVGTDAVAVGPISVQQPLIVISSNVHVENDQTAVATNQAPNQRIED